MLLTLLIELSEVYAEIAKVRLAEDTPMFTKTTIERVLPPMVDMFAVKEG